MTVQKQIDAYIAGQPDGTRADMLALHKRVRKVMPRCKLWFLDGTDETGKKVSNPNIGYGLQTMTYADGKTRDFYQVGMSPNTGGISFYIIGIKDRTFLPRKFGKTIGKASVTGYCIKFKKLSDIDLDVLEAAIRDGIERTRED